MKTFLIPLVLAQHTVSAKLIFGSCPDYARALEYKVGDAAKLARPWFVAQGDTDFTWPLWFM